MLPLRAPTMRSVPEIVSAKLWRAPVRTFSTPSSSMTLTAMASTVSMAVSQRLRSDCRARRRTIMRAAPRSAGGDLVEPHHTVEAAAEALSWLTMIRVAPAARTSANSRSRNAAWRLRSSAEVGSSATISSGRADQRAGGGDALLLADAQVRRREPARQRAARGRAASSRRTASSSARTLARSRARGACGAKLSGSSTLSMTVP